MTFLWREFVDSCVKSPGQFDWGAYGVVVEFVQGATYQAIGGHHLDPSENVGKHNVYVCIVDEQGKRIPGARFMWNRIGLEDKPYTVTCDKPDNEPWGNMALDSMNVVASVWCADGLSDRVKGLSTAHPDEGTSGGNTFGHHSYLVVFQRGVATPEPPPTPTPGADVPQALARIAEAVRALDEARKALTL